MATTKQEFVDLADELFEEFADFVSPGVFELTTGFNRQTGEKTNIPQTVDGIQTKVSLKVFEARNVQIGDYMQVYRKRFFEWLPEIGKTIVTMKGIKQQIVDIKYDPADAAVFLHVRRL